MKKQVAKPMKKENHSPKHERIEPMKDKIKEYGKKAMKKISVPKSKC